VVWRACERVTAADTSEAVLAEFQRHRQDFEEAVRRAPDAALRYRSDGEDYALGGLVVHVTDVLKHYTRVLETIHATDWQAGRAPDHQTSAEDAAVIRAGFSGERRAQVVGDMQAAHDAFVESVRAEPADWFERQASVTYAGSTEPHPTSPSDVVGWLRDHYIEHTRQVAELVSDWAVATR
jgi:hypothetical protein